MQRESRVAKQAGFRKRDWRNVVLGILALGGALAGSAAQAALTDVYRFYHLDAGRHFYTASVEERDKVLRLYPRFAYEGPRFQAYMTQEPGTVPVYRFYHQGNGSHVYSASETEKATILQNYPIYAYEGIAYYAETNGSTGAVPLLRMYNTKLGTHFFTTNASEATYAVNTWPWFVLEGATFYVRSEGGTPGGNNMAPVASLTVSSQSVLIGATVTMTVAASDPDGTVEKVEFYKGTEKIGTVTGAPFSINYTFAEAGTFMIGAVATDNAGAVGAATPIQVTVSAEPGGGGGGPPPPPPPTGGNQPPVVTLTASATAITTGSSTTLTANASDPDGTIAQVMFYNGGSLVATDTSAPYTYTFTPMTAGNYTLTAVAVDNQGAQANSNTVTVVVTAPPTSSSLPRITLSINNTLLNGAGTVNLTGNATATATGATISRVSFYMDGVKLVDDTTTPYTFTANIPGAGTYQIYAQVQDSLGNINNTLTQTVVSKTPAPAITPTADAWRLLNQATFGPTQAEAQRVQSMGIAAWINDQFTKPISGYPDTKYNRIQLSTTADCTTAMPGGGNYPNDSPQAICSRDHLTLAMVQRDFFLNAVFGADQLRQRVAWALSQIVVTSAAEQDLSYAYVMSRYQNIMFEEAFGNYEELLRRVTYNPAMGNYLDMVNNDKTNGTTRVPNENYAREIMQLFSIGLEELNADGTPLLDAQGKPIPTYGQAEIAEFARVFTGYTYATAANPYGPATGKQNTRYYATPMIPYPSTATTGHDTGAKTLLNGTILPAGQTPQTDVDAAVRNVFMHPNTGPYVSKQLIQRLVTGNPSPAYVARISAVFANNGSGVRGDLQAVVRAILLDPEARGPMKTAPDYGSLKEPVLMITGLLRALSGITDGSRLEGAANNLGQRPYYSPTVFNYFPPDQTILGTSVLGPEFAIHTTNSAVGRANLVYTLVYNGYNPDTTIVDSSGTKLFLAQFESLATTPAAMVSEINKVLAGGLFPAALEATIVTAVNAVPISATPTAQQRTDRVRMAVYLMASSYDYQVQR